MGAVFFFTFLPIILVVLGIAATMILAGIIIFVIGMSGSIVSATALNDRLIKRMSIYFFGSLFLLGLSCLAVIGGFFASVYFFIAPMLSIIGLTVVAVGVVGIIKSCNITQKMPKVVLITLLTLSTIMGMVVFVIGALMLIAS